MPEHSPCLCCQKRPMWLAQPALGLDQIIGGSAESALRVHVPPAEGLKSSLSHDRRAKWRIAETHHFEEARRVCETSSEMHHHVIVYARGMAQGKKRKIVAGGCGHPTGVKPWGAFWLLGGPNCRPTGLGALNCLPDDLILSILSHLSAQDLCRAATSSQALYCFCAHEDLWKTLTLQELQGRFSFQSCWKVTYLNGFEQASGKFRAGQLQCKSVFSDLLYQPWLCATAPLTAAWLQTDNLERRGHLSPVDFREGFEAPSRPVVVSMASSWPACSKWSREYLLEAFGAEPVVVGEMDMKLQDYLCYQANARDEMPLYLFDKHWLHKAPKLQNDIEVPNCFEDDLFAALGSQRPDHSWLIWGPARSGSTFHKDPNGTSAWNAVVCGSKKWILYPPHVCPPGVHASPDGADVACPVSLMEWFLQFYGQTQKGHVRPVEGVVRAGEVLFVPRGWWHLAMNLEETIAVTQNFVSRVNLPHVLQFLRSRRTDLVSGCALEDRGLLHDRFLDALRKQHPEFLEASAEPSAALPQAFASTNSSSASAFSFGFNLSY